MGKLMCEICGCEALLKEGERFRCTGCGAYYSPEHLKSMLNAPVAEESVAALQPEDPVPAAMQEETVAEQVAPPHRKAKPKTVITIIAVAVIALGFFVLILGAIISSSGIVPQKSKAKDLAEEHLSYRIFNEEITLTNIRFTSVTATQFQTREEDYVGFFQYMEKPMTLVDQNGNKTEYEDHFEELRTRLGEQYDPEADTKWAYTLTGTYDADHTEYGDIEGEFSIVYVHMLAGNCWYPIKTEFGASEEMLREDVYNYLMAYLLLNYDIQPNPNIELTSIEKDQYDNYTVYGTITVKDNYNDKYYGKFVAQYDYSSYDQHFERESVEVEELSRNPLLDIFN